MNRNYFGSLWVVVSAFMFFQCARIGTPTGGEKDQTPPVLVKAIPAENSVEFNGRKIFLYFDEYITLKDIQKQLIVSPPMKENPEFIPSTGVSKKIEIRIKDTLLKNTTYLLNFGNSIKDHNEGNTLSFFQYVFSTGNRLDSLKLSGSISDAIKAKPDNFVSIMLYKKDSLYNDSIVYKQKPTYITNTLDSASTFNVPFIKEGEYAVIALKDAASNYIFNPEKDKIGFINHFVKIPTDSLYAIPLFKEKPKYKASRPTQTAGNKIIFPYTGADSLPKVRIISEANNDFLYISSKENAKDTINFWFAPKLKDSAVFTVKYQQKTDTFRIKIKEMKPESLKLEPVKLNIYPQQTLYLQSNIPLKKINPNRVLIRKKDSLPVDFQVNITKNTQCSIDFLVDYNQEYQIKLLPNAVTDFFGQTNDTLQFNIKSKSKESYGTFKLKLISNKITYPILIQITDLKGDKIINELSCHSYQSVFTFNHVNPGKYRIRIIEDKNKNGLWDTGNYLKRIQPEKTIYLPKEIDLRANWEIIEEFNY